MRFVHFGLALSFFIALGLAGCSTARTASLPAPVPMPVLSPLPGSSHPTYTITDLGAGMPRDINNQGQVIGHFLAGVFPDSNGLPYAHGCLWDKGKRIEMPTLGGWYSEADRINDRKEILGTATIALPQPVGAPMTHLCLWNGRKLTDLDADPRFHGAGLAHIARSGTVYAVSPPQGPDKQIHLWVYPSGFGPGVRRDGGVIGDTKLSPIAINDAGMVVGTWDTGVVRRHAMLHRTFVWHKGDTHWTDIGTFGGPQSEPSGVNDAGQVAGTADLPRDPKRRRFRTHAFLWEKGKMKDLGTLPGGSFSRPSAINNKGQVVGFSDLKGDRTDDRPVLWERGRIKDLTEFIPRGTQWTKIGNATGINDRGQIIGDGATANLADRHVHAFVLTPR